MCLCQLWAALSLPETLATVAASIYQLLAHSFSSVWLNCNLGVGLPQNGAWCCQTGLVDVDFQYVLTSKDLSFCFGWVCFCHEMVLYHGAEWQKCNVLIRGYWRFSSAEDDIGRELSIKQCFHLPLDLTMGWAGMRGTGGYEGWGGTRRGLYLDRCSFQWNHHWRCLTTAALRTDLMDQMTQQNETAIDGPFCRVTL